MIREVIELRRSRSMIERNENDLEERMYATLHHVDASEGNLILQQNRSDGWYNMESAPMNTLRRYWCTNEPTTLCQKVNTPKEPIHTSLKTDLKQTNQTAKFEEKKSDLPKFSPSADLSIFQTPVSKDLKRTIDIVKHDNRDDVRRESSDEDEVIEVALPPKPSITIGSSDKNQLTIINPDSPSTSQLNMASKTVSSEERDVTASPAPSAVSSGSDSDSTENIVTGNESGYNIENQVEFDYNSNIVDNGSTHLEQEPDIDFYMGRGMLCRYEYIKERVQIMYQNLNSENFNQMFSLNNNNDNMPSNESLWFVPEDREPDSVRQSHWDSISCFECGARGHPASHCPYLQCSYHNTIESDGTSQDYCNKRQPESPTTHETHMNKKKTTVSCEDTELPTNDIIDKVKTDEGKPSLNGISKTYRIDVQNDEMNSFFSITGIVGDQERLQAQLRDRKRVGNARPASAALDNTTTHFGKKIALLHQLDEEE